MVVTAGLVQTIGGGSFTMRIVGTVGSIIAALLIASLAAHLNWHVAFMIPGLVGASLELAGPAAAGHLRPFILSQLAAFDDGGKMLLERLESWANLREAQTEMTQTSTNHTAGQQLLFAMNRCRVNHSAGICNYGDYQK